MPDGTKIPNLDAVRGEIDARGGASITSAVTALAGADAGTITGAGGLPTLAGLNARINGIQSQLAARRDWTRLMNLAWDDLTGGRLDVTERRTVKVSGTGSNPVQINRVHATLGGDRSTAFVSAITRYSLDGGLTYLDVAGRMTLDVGKQTISSLNTAFPSGTDNIWLDATVTTYGGIGATTDRYEVVAVSDRLVVSTGGSGTNGTGDDFGAFPVALPLGRLPSNDYGNWFSSGVSRHDGWYTRQAIPTEVVVGFQAERSMVSVPISAAAGGAHSLVGSLLQGTAPNARTRGMGYAVDETSNAGMRAASRALTTAIPRVVAWYALVRRLRDDRLLLAVQTDAQRSASTIETLNSTNTAAFDVFPLIEEIYHA